MNKDSFKIPINFSKLNDQEKLDLINKIIDKDPKNDWAIKQLNNLDKKFHKNKFLESIGKYFIKNYKPIIGLLLILGISGYFAINYTKAAKETKRNQDLLQQQINSQNDKLKSQ